MCLLVEKTKDIEASIAEADIISYKVLFKSPLNGRLITPYQKSCVESGVEYKSNLEFIEYQNTKSNYNHVTIGLHSIDSLSSAKLLLGCMFLRHNAIIYKCIIPKGSKYYKGIFKAGKHGIADYTLFSYASDRLTYVEEVNTVIEDDKIFNELLNK